MSAEQVEKVLVDPAEWMERETFVMHFNARHSGSLGGMDSLPANIDPRVEAAYRAFHRRLHDVRVDLSHEHDA
jgi:hypothetical protein